MVNEPGKHGQASAENDADSGVAHIQNDRTLETIAEEARTLTTRENADYKLTLKLEKGDLLLTASIKPKRKGPIIQPQDVLTILKEQNIKGTINQFRIKDLCNNACKNTSQEHVVIATGRAPIKGRDETLEFLAQPSSKVAQFSKDRKGNIDYSDGHFFENVFPDQEIARLLPAQEGKPGLSLTGQELQASTGISLEKEPVCGENVTFHDNAFKATHAGRVIYENNTISITDELIIPGSVNHNTGNIDFVGFVIIKGDVENGFSVKGEKGIVIHGNVGNARLESKGDIEIKGGMSGNEIGSICCVGNLTARYIDDVTVECEGDIKIAKELINSRVKCGGALNLPSGSIVGGRYMAFKGIDAYDIGAETGAKTRVEAGMHYKIQEQIAELRQRYKESIKQTGTLKKRVDHFLRNPDKLAELPAESRVPIEAAIEQLKEAEAHKEVLKLELEEMRKSVFTKANPLVIVHHVLYNRVTLCFSPNHAFETKVTRRQPLSVLENSQNGKLRFTGLHRLSEKAKDIEKAIRIREAHEEQKHKHQESNISV